MKKGVLIFSLILLLAGNVWAALINTKLNGPLTAGGDVNAFRISPDGNRVVYNADQDTDGVIELYSRPLDGSGSIAKLNGPLTLGGGAWSFTISPDSSRVVYRAAQDTVGVDELYSRPLDGSGSIVKLNGPLPFSWSVESLQISPDNSRVVYTISQKDEYGRVVGRELYSSPIDGSGPAVKLNGPLPLYGTVNFFAISPDSGRVVYSANVVGGGDHELCSSPIDGSGSAVKLYGTLPSDWAVEHFAISPDSSRVVYRARMSGSSASELYSKPIDGSGPAVKLNGTLPLYGAVYAFLISPDGSRVVYSADQDTDNVMELYSSPLDGSGSSVKLNGPLTPGGNVNYNYFAISPDSSRVVYSADQDTHGVIELYSSPLDGSGSSVKLNGPLTPGGGLFPQFAFTPDSSRVVYSAIQDTVGVSELYSRPLDGSGSVVKLNGPLTPGGYVPYYYFAISPDSSRVVYLADQDTVDVWELYSSVIATAEPIDTTPDPFTFANETGVALNTVITSNIITVSGINTSAPISITGGEYAINSGKGFTLFTSTTGTVNNGDDVVIRVRSARTYSASATVDLAIGDVTRSFVVTTMALPPGVALGSIAGQVSYGKLPTVFEVNILDATNAVLIATSVTDDKGFYDSGSLPIGAYKVRFSGLQYSSAYFGAGGEDIFDLGAPVIVQEGQATVVNESLQYIGPVSVVTCNYWLSGTITDASDSMPLAGIKVSALDSLNAIPVAVAFTDFTGSYLISTKNATSCGQVKVRFSDPSSSYLPQYYGANGRDIFALGVFVDWMNQKEPKASTTMALPGVIVPGAGVTTEPAPGIDLTFDSVSTGGTVTVTPLTNSSPPSNFRIVGVNTYDITFNGSFSGSVKVCISYNDSDVHGNENNLKFMHFTNPGGWTDITTSRDTVNNIICGVTTSFSEFAVMEPISNRPPVAAFATGADAPSLSGWTVTVKDSSTDPDGNMTGSTAITVRWGDGSYSRCAPGGIVSHTYAVAGNYTISLTAADAAGLTNTVTASTPVMITLGKVTGTVTSGGVPVSMAKVQLTRPGGPNPYAYTNTSGVYTINNVKPGAVTLTATKGLTNYGTKSVTVASGINTVDFP